LTLAIALLDLLTEKTIGLDVEAADWRESVRLAGALLLHIDAILPSYINAMVRVLEELGPYVVVAPGIALAHARPEDGVKRMCMSLVRLASPVKFGSEANDPVDLVFAFGAVDKEGHLQALRELAIFLQKEEAVAAVRECDSPEKALQVISEHSREA